MLETSLGTLCKRGHDRGGGSIRFAHNGLCVDCKKLSKPSEQAKVRIASRMRAYHERNKDVVRERNKAWAVANRPTVAEYNRNRRTANPVAARAAEKRWRDDHPGLVASKTFRRRLATRNATPLWADLNAIDAVYLKARATSAQTGVEHHVDHIVPLRGKNVCGLHVAHNLQILPATANIKKSNVEVFA